MNPNPRNIRQAKAHYRAHLGIRTNGGRKGRIKDARPKGSKRGRV